MRIVNLMEDTKGNEACIYEHGLSFYIETKKHKMLVDTGATDAFIGNAEKLGIDLKQVDTVILSHGHYDHGGGLLAFAKLNPDAKIYMQETASGQYYHKNEKLEKYIGLHADIAKLTPLHLVSGNMQIDEELFLFSDVKGRRLWPAGNYELMCKNDSEFVQDDFGHEQYLVLSAENRKFLISGCAHNGILNILDKYRAILGGSPDAVISGFHMMKKAGYTEEDISTIKETAQELIQTNTMFYTGHCTGEYPFEVMQEIMGEQLMYVHCGEAIDLE